MSLTVTEIEALTSKFERINRQFPSQIAEDAIDELADLWCDLETRAESESEKLLRSAIGNFLFDAIVEQCPKIEGGQS